MSLSYSELDNVNRPFEYYLSANSSQIGRHIKLGKFPELDIQVITIDRKKHQRYEDIDHIDIALLVNGNTITVSDTDLDNDKVHTINSHGFKYIFQGVKPAFEGPGETHLVMYVTKVPQHHKPEIIREPEMLYGRRSPLIDEPRMSYGRTSVLLPEDNLLSQPRMSYGERSMYLPEDDLLLTDIVVPRSTYQRLY